MFQMLHSASEMSTANGQNCPLLKHIAIIMDGNRRWAREKKLPIIEGHRQGVEALKTTVKALKNYDIKYLTVFAFSSENWRRNPQEVAGLMQLIRYVLKREIADLHTNGVQVRIIGDRSRMPKDIVDHLNYAENLTKDNTGLVLTISISYGARSDIVSAARKIAKKIKMGEISPSDICEETFADHLSTSGVPDPDLLIRTSGEQRISNFLLWELSYAEFIFQKVYWPDYNQDYLAEAIREFCKRDRRFGESCA